LSSILYVVLLAPIHVFAAVPNPVLRVDSCSNSYVVLVVLEERGFGFNLGYRPSSFEEF
jgi:hypothetical protein